MTNLPQIAVQCKRFARPGLWLLVSLFTPNFGHAASVVDTHGAMRSTGELTFTFDSTGSYIRKQIFIDSDTDSATGFDTGYDILIENGTILEYTGAGGSDWSWNAVGTASGPTGSGNDSVNWTFDANLVGSVQPTAPLLFVLQDANGNTTNSTLLGITDTEMYPQDDLTNFANPERGLYLYTELQADINGDYVWSGANASALRSAGKTLVLLIVDMRNEVNSAQLPSSLLNELDSALSELEANGLKAVFRGRYKEDAGGCPANSQYEPNSVNTIIGHIQQLGEVLNNHKGAIAYIEAGMIGRWGEWNCSIHDIDDPQLAIDIAGTWIQEVPGRHVGLRRPRFKADAPFTNNQSTWVSHYNDCFLWNADHMGTYDAGTSMSTVQEYRDYLQGTATTAGQTASVPIGGENCGISASYPDSGDNYAPIANQIDPYCTAGQLALTDYRYTYLNERPTAWMENWIAEGCWEQIKSSLGYRFDIQRVDYAGAFVPGLNTQLNLTVVNRGYAKLYNSRTVKLVFSSNGVIIDSMALTTVDPSLWTPGLHSESVSFTVPVGLAPGSYELGLLIPDPQLVNNPLQAIRFANDGWDVSTGVHYLGDVNIVASTESCNGLPVTVNIGLGQSPTPNADVILGTAGSDVIRAKAGNDTICGLGGNDFIHGNSGDDWIDGGEGIDNIRGGRGNDIIFTGTGATIGTTSRAFGGYGDDQITGGPDADDLRGGRGSDTIDGSSGDDVLSGNEGNDVLNGSSGFDTLNGGAGNDELNGNANDDVLNGGNGDDNLNGGGGSGDYCDGGSGSSDTATASCETTVNVP